MVTLIFESTNMSLLKVILASVIVPTPKNNGITLDAGIQQIMEREQITAVEAGASTR